MMIGMPPRPLIFLLVHSNVSPVNFRAILLTLSKFWKAAMEEIVPDVNLMKYLESAADQYHAALLENQGAMDYLLSRGINRATWDSFKLGIVDDPFPDHTSYAGRISIPYMTVSGIATMRFKAIPDSNGMTNGAKMLSLPGALGKGRPYNIVDALTTTDVLVIAEGEPDTWTVSQLGIPVIGIPGAKAWKRIFKPLFLYRGDLIVIVHNDDDGSGRAFANSVSANLPYARHVLMPEGHDANSLFNEIGGDGLLEALGI
jgi:DNA primase